ncbi:MAG: dipeptide epimerase [Nitrospiraceae bacterium]
MDSQKSHTIAKIEFWPMDIPITDPFVVATGTRMTAQNVFIRITLKGGTQGYDEAAPFPEVGGEDRDSCLAALVDLSKTLLGRSVADFHHIGRTVFEQAPPQPAARCGLETALLDAYCRTSDMPMWRLWGGADVRARETDITIPITDRETTITRARAWHAKGFRLFKMKVGHDVDEDVRRLEAVHRALPDIAFIGDGNQGFSRDDCIVFVNGVKKFGGNLILLEQPLVRDDLDGLSAIRHLTGIPIAVDEAVRSLDDAKAVLRKQAADYINIKIMKTGVIQALEIAEFARGSGLRLMIGGMVETRVAMGCSFAMALGLGGFEALDLDTPLLLSTDPVKGGYRYEGSRLHPWFGPGLDLVTDPSKDMMTIQ